MIFDTNVLIYLSKYKLNPERIFFNDAQPSISIITKIETLGFNFKDQEEHLLLENLCNELHVFQLTDSIASATINIRRNNRIKLPDAIIYATALTEGLPLVTNNLSDFERLGSGVKLIDPFTL